MTAVERDFSLKFADQFWGPPSLLFCGEPAFCLEVKRPGRDAEHSPTSSAELKMGGAIILLRTYAFIAATGTNSPVYCVGATKAGTLRSKADTLFVVCLHGCPRQATDVLQPAGLLYRPLWTVQL
jgi:hypothetical protein